jgi:hypothetical protein
MPTAPVADDFGRGFRGPPRSLAYGVIILSPRAAERRRVATGANVECDLLLSRIAGSSVKTSKATPKP